MARRKDKSSERFDELFEIARLYKAREFDEADQRYDKFLAEFIRDIFPAQPVVCGIDFLTGFPAGIAMQMAENRANLAQKENAAEMRESKKKIQQARDKDISDALEAAGANIHSETPYKEAAAALEDVNTWLEAKGLDPVNRTKLGRLISNLKNETKV
jgi:hypothetical protein